MSRSLFRLVVPLARTDPLFRIVLERYEFTAARRLMDEVFADFRDVDKSFVREFQTSGFSSRVFELALFAYLAEQGFELDRSHPAPDFLIGGRMPFGIEATTSNPNQEAEPSDDEVRVDQRWPNLPADLPAADREFVFQMGKALRRKLVSRDAERVI